MSRKLINFPIILSALVALAFWLLRAECVSSESRDVECLSQAAWAFDSFRGFVQQTLNDVGVQSYLTYSVFTGIAGLGLIALCALCRGELSKWGGIYISAVAVSALGELFAFREQVVRVQYLQLTACFLSLIAFILLGRRRDDSLAKGWIEPGEHSARPTVYEAIGVFIIFFLIVCTRFYALNRLPAVWDHEGCAQRPIAASWRLIIEQELGRHVQASSGLAWVVIQRLFNRLTDPLYFYLGERFVGVAISLVNCLVVYILLRCIRGPFAAVLGLIVFGFGPLDLDWSRLPSLHHLPVTAGLLLTWATFVAFSARSWPSFVAVAILIVVCKFVYPSAKLLGLAPALGAMGVLLWQRGSWFGHKRKLLFVILGLFLFTTIRSIFYSVWSGKLGLITPIPLMYQAGASNSLWDLIVSSSRESFGFLYEIFYGRYQPSHWTTPATIEPLRSVPSICVVFAVMALLRLVFLIRQPYALICVGLVVGGLIPGIMTSAAERRIGYSLIFLSLLSVVEIAWFVDAIAVGKVSSLNRKIKGLTLLLVGISMFSLQCQGYFSRPHGEVLQNRLTERVRAMIAPNMLVVYLSVEYRCDFFYGIYDKLVQAGGDIGFATAYDTPKGPEEMIQDPSPILISWHYYLTDLEPQISSLKERTSWPRLLYVFEDIQRHTPWKELLATRYPSGKVSTYELGGLWNLRFFFFDTAPDQSHGS